MKSVMKKDFGRLPETDIQRSTFDRSCGYKTAFNSGYLVPIYLDEVLPGDEFRMDANLFARLSPTVTPPMDNVFVDTQWFFCPSRLLWTNFVKMMGERVNPKDSIDYLVPQLDSGAKGFEVGSLADYFGIPTNVPNLKVNALPFRMYAKIWDDWYRDENLQDSIIQSTDDLGDSNGTIAWNTLLRRGKRKDYFTSALPWPQKGDAVNLPLGKSAPVYGNSTASANMIAKKSDGTYSLFPLGAGRTYYDHVGLELKGADGHSDPSYSVYNLVSKGAGVDSNVYADLSNATAATINSLRLAWQLQRLLERDARGGTRYIELIRSHFATICPDARLQRSEYLGGSSQMLNFSQVAQTSATDATTPQGNLTANGVFSGGAGFRKAFTEHGYVIGIVNVRCDLNYQQGLDRLWSRRGRYDFYWPVLAHLGEQSVLNKEIYAQGSAVKDANGNVVDDQPFGYQERFAEYRYKPSVITGKMRSTATGSLDVWHLAQKFDKLPQLDKEFIQDHPPLERILAVTDEPQFVLDCYFKLLCTRPMPTFSVPGLVDHF